MRRERRLIRLYGRLVSVLCITMDEGESWDVEMIKKLCIQEGAILQHEVTLENKYIIEFFGQRVQIYTDKELLEKIYELTP